MQLSHINDLSKMLKSVRRAYLDVSSESSSFGRQSPRNLDLGRTDHSWSSVRHLTNEERDQVDLQARLIISKCAERVKDMEMVEKSMSRLVHKINLSPDSKSCFSHKNARNSHPRTQIHSCVFYRPDYGKTLHPSRLPTSLRTTQA